MYKHIKKKKYFIRTDCSNKIYRLIIHIYLIYIYLKLNHEQTL